MMDSTRLIPSGISLVDRAWGGFYRGGSYLIVGPRKSGRTSLALQFASEAAARKERCVYFTTMRPRYLSIQAEAVGIPIEQMLADNLITVMRIVSPSSPSSGGSFTEYVEAIQESIQTHCPSRMVFDELTPLVSEGGNSDTSNALAFLTETLESSGVTSLYVLGEPATRPARDLADSFIDSMTGMICLQRRGVSSIEDLPGGKILIAPNIGHPEGHFMTTFNLEPRKQLQMDDRPAWSRPALKAPGMLRSGTETASERPTATTFPPIRRDHMQENDLVSAENTLSGSDVGRRGLCSAHEFLEEINASLEASRNTGALPRVVAFRVTPSEGANDLLTLEQVARAVETVGGPGHKVCIHDNIVMAVGRSNDSRDIHALLAKHVEEAMHGISGVLIHVSQQFDDTEALLAFIERKFSTTELLS